MKKLLAVLSLLAVVGCAPETQPVRKVYAHYMGCFPAACGAMPYYFGELAKQAPAARLDRARRNAYDSVGGQIVNWPLVPEGFVTNSLADAKLEIARAIRAGIDGFVFDAWAGDANAKKLLDVFFQAAEEMKADFGLTICFDPSCHPHGPNDGTMLEQYVKTAQFVLRHADSPNLARFDGKPLFFGYYSDNLCPRQKGETAEAWRARVAEAWGAWRKALPGPVFLHGSIDAMANVRDATPEQMRALGTWAGRTFDAVGGFLGTDNGWGLDTNLVASVKAAGGEWSQPMFFQYSNKLGGIVTDAGLNHLRCNWDAAIRNGSHLLQFVTWNDYGEETCLAPAYGTAYTVARVNRHFAEKWKTGREPRVEKDEVHAVFRRAVSTEDPYPFLSRRVERRPSALEIDLFLTAPAKVEVAGHGAFDAPAGYSFKQFPLKEGAIRVAVKRGGEKVLDWTCPETVAANAWREDMMLAAYGTNYEDEWKLDFHDAPLFVYAENADDDGDGMPNWYEMIYFGKFPRMSSATAGDPDGDPDGDGRTNLQEFRDRTNPLVADAAGYGVGFVWRLGDLKDDRFLTNPFKDAKGRARWHAAYKFGPRQKIARDGDYVEMDWCSDSLRHRAFGVYKKNPYGSECGSVSVSTNGVVAVQSRQECLMALGFRAPEAGVYAAGADVVGGRGQTCVRVSLARGAEELAAKAVRQDEAATLAAEGVALKVGETLWLVFDGANVWGMGATRITRWDVTRVK